MRTILPEQWKINRGTIEQIILLIKIMNPQQDQNGEGNDVRGAQFVNYAANRANNSEPNISKEPVVPIPTPNPTPISDMSPNADINRLNTQNANTIPNAAQDIPANIPMPNGFNVQPNMMPPVMSSNMTMPTMPMRKRKWVNMVLGIVLVVLIVAAGAYAVYATYIDPAKVMPALFAGSNTSTSAHVDAEFTSNIPKVPENSGSLAVHMDFVPAGRGKYNVSGTLGLNMGTSTAELGLAVVDNVFYGKINSLEISGIPKAYLDIISGYMNKWYSLSIDKLEAARGGSIDTRFKDMSSIYNKAVLNGIIGKQSFAGITTVTGKMYRKYSIELNKSSIANAAAQFYVDNGLLQNSSAAQLTRAAQTEAMAMGIKFAIDKLDIKPIVVYVDLFSNRLRGFDAGLEITDDFAQMYSNTELTNLAGATIDLNVMYSDLAADKQVIDAPKDVTSLDSYIENYLNPADGAQSLPESK